MMFYIATLKLHEKQTPPYLFDEKKVGEAASWLPLRPRARYFIFAESPFLRAGGNTRKQNRTTLTIAIAKTTKSWNTANKKRDRKIAHLPAINLNLGLVRDFTIGSARLRHASAQRQLTTTA
jgi:hypothetical protein